MTLIRQEDLVRVFALRTRANLEILRSIQCALRKRANLETLRSILGQKSDLEIYEVTQLINSMLGLLVFPEQKYIKQIPETPIEDLERDGWPIPEVEGTYPQVKNLNQLVRYLRNGISHCNLEFLSDDGVEITGIRIWNKTNGNRGKINWKARLKKDDLERITEKFIQLLEGNRQTNTNL